MNPNQMLAFLEGKASNRKLWLLSCGWCRRHRFLMDDARCRAAIEVGERFADGEATADELAKASEEAFCRRDDLAGDDRKETAAIAAALSVIDPADRDSALPPMTTVATVQGTSGDLVRVAELSVVVEVRPAEREQAQQGRGHDERAAQSVLLRDVFGPLLFRRLTLDNTWLTTNVTSLAQAIYDDRAFYRLPILADALEDAGCTSAEILGHCRKPGPHVRGCWVVDQILRKE